MMLSLFVVVNNSLTPTCCVLQSLGQNFLSDQNYVKKIVNVFQDDSEVSQILAYFLFLLL